MKNPIVQNNLCLMVNNFYLFCGCDVLHADVRAVINPLQGDHQDEDEPNVLISSLW